MNTESSEKKTKTWKIKTGKIAKYEYFEWLEANHTKLFYKNFCIFNIIANYSLRKLYKFAFIQVYRFDECGISKPTRLSKIKELVEAGLIQTEQTIMNGKKALIKYTLMLPEELENAIQWRATAKEKNDGKEVQGDYEQSYFNSQ